jgi:rubredoxin
MKFLCSVCDRLVTLGAFRTEGTELFLACPQCGAENRAQGKPHSAPGPSISREAVSPAMPLERPIPEASPTPEPERPLRVVPFRRPKDAVPPALDPPAHVCPKCVGPRQANASTCPACGLVFDNYRPSEHQPPPELTKGWEALSARWDDSVAHDDFLLSAMARGELAAAARLYRIRLAHAPDDAMAQRGREEVLRLALAPTGLLTEKQDPVPVSRLHWKRWAPWAVFLVLLFWALWKLMAGMGMP